MKNSRNIRKQTYGNAMIDFKNAFKLMRTTGATEMQMALEIAYDF